MSAGPIQRLGLNRGGYRGETVELEPVLGRLERLARAAGWDAERFGPTAGVDLLGLVSNREAEVRVYISAGIHGDEPAGPISLLRMFERGLWPPGVGLWVCPCLNPAGFARHTRENAQGLDLNRQYLNTIAEETLAHKAWLEHQPGYEAAICLHEDWESGGFYLYELLREGRRGWGREIIQAVQAVCPVDFSPEIEGRKAEGGVIQPSIDPRSRPDWPEAFHLMNRGVAACYTLEAPSDFSLDVRVEALVTAMSTSLHLMNGPVTGSGSRR